jgi:hypothetical protein
MNKKDIKKLLTKAKNNGKKYIDHFPICYKKLFDGSDECFKIKNIEIRIEPLKEKMYGYACLTHSGQHILKINHSVEEKMLFEVVTHEFTHILDYQVSRESSHDLQFLHNWTILSGFEIDLVRQLSCLVERESDIIKYKDVIKHDYRPWT